MSSLLRDAENRKIIHGIKIGRHVNPISHLFFANDSLLFVRASKEEVEGVLEILSTYEVASGQKLNMDKSEVSFSRNIEQERKNMLQMKLSFKAVERHEKYLGLPTYIGSSKKQVFHNIQDRVWKKLKGWKGNFLSQAGREVLIKSIAHAIPTYAMHCFSIPNSILNGIEKMCRQFFWGQKGEERKLCWVAWEKLYVSKKEGGLGFRNMKIFNEALLAKQAWCILSNEDSFVARVLKGKYFPHTTLMEAKIQANASYTWRSIMGAREVLAKGVRKAVGNGSTVHNWKDPWIPNLPNFRTLEAWFSSVEVNEICNIPIPMFDRKDSWVWHYTKDGNYSVRSAYNLLTVEQKNDTASNSTTVSKVDWSMVWDAELPPKVKFFSWRAMKNAVAARYSLAKRAMPIDTTCPMCGNDVESALHMLIKCEEAKRIWRNAWVFDGRKKDASETIHKAVGMVGDYESALENSTLSSNPQQFESQWKPPVEGVIKINSDAATFGSNQVGLGAVMRDRVGDVVASTCLCLKGNYEVDVVEALAMRHALAISLESGFNRVCLKTDCLKLHHHLKKKTAPATAFGLIVHDILKLALQCQEYSSFVKRGGNRVAHELAKISSSFTELRVWMEEVPLGISDFVIVDLNALID
ncbi:uncharacterized protein LOC110716751 [Chenopodium quinoa]|uniref:uncharacterized protein LOC110716751 n=1 Tax=Chenopodium quinoa TaxID=63459 RepID=UPI000B798703|nr:uncharacterized protein LOC110716751 [Chenopodium quinoa]